MVLDELLHVVAQVQDRIRKHGATLRENETRTRVALIDPVLRVLGWDVSDPGLVTLEARLGPGSADYALLTPDNRLPAAIIEAKRLGESLAGHREQMVGYCVQAGVAFAALTNGDQWLLYDVWSRRPLDEKQIFDVSLANAPGHEVALLMLPLLRPNLASAAPVTATPLTRVQQPVQAQESLSGRWVALTDYNPPPGTQPPTTIRFFDGEERRLGKWNRILVRVAEKLHSDGTLNLEGMPIRRSEQRHIASNTPKHPNGRVFDNARRVAEGIFVEGGLSARDSRHLAKRLLQHCGLDPSQVRLNVEP